MRHSELEQDSILSLARQGSNRVSGNEWVFGVQSVLRVRKGLKGKVSWMVIGQRCIRMRRHHTYNAAHAHIQTGSNNMQNDIFAGKDASNINLGMRARGGHDAEGRPVLMHESCNFMNHRSWSNNSSFFSQGFDRALSLC